MDEGSAFTHETERLTLRDWREEDWPEFFKHTNTPAVMEHLGGVLPDDKHQWLRERFEGYKRDSGFTFWVVERREDGQLLGFCGLKRSNQEPGPIGLIEAGWRLREDAWGKGYAREAAEATLALGFERFGADFIIALTIQENVPSWRLMERLGMERRADLDFDSTDFGTESVIAYSITREQWAQNLG